MNPAKLLPSAIVPTLHKRAAQTGGSSISAISVPVRLNLSRKRYNTVVYALVFHDTGQAGFDVGIFDEKTHAAAELSLDGPGCRGDPVFHIVLQEQIPKSQSLLVVEE